MDFSTLRTEFFAAGFSDLNDASSGLVRAKRFINEAYRSISERYPFPWLYKDASGTAPLTISDARQVLTVLDSTNDNVLVPIDRRTLQEQSPDLPDTGTPSYWFWDSDTSLAVYPASTSITLKVRYVKNPADLSADGDLPLVPAQYQQAIVDLAVAKAHRNLANYEAAQWHEQAAEQLIQQLVIAYGTRQGDMPDVVQDVVLRG